MPPASPAAVRKQVAQGKPDPIYLIVGDDEAEMAGLVGELSNLVEDELRAFNVERLYATDRATTPAAIAEAARVLPMMSTRRVVVVLRAEKLLKPKRKGKGDGRTYTIVATVTDGSGNPTSVSTTVVVSHSQGNKKK